MNIFNSLRVVSVWVSYPLKQGLKLTCKLVADRCSDSLSQLSIKTRIETSDGYNGDGIFIPVWVSYPLKQGLKQKETGMEKVAVAVWVSYPLKQGLKQIPILSMTLNWHSVWVSYPLKQGLKRSCQTSSITFSASLSQLSIKTRIETWGRVCRWVYWGLFESAIH